MEIFYKVNSVADDYFEAEVDYQDRKVMAKMPVLVVELVSTDPGQVNPVLRVPPERRKEFPVGAVIVGTFAPQSAGSEEPDAAPIVPSEESSR